ncbi:unnamed protein product [Acanthoscelides obtectus]|nr:unnamed protein product [Acanthoscelides obtectus]CAK1621206.1 UDP-glucuronosyltransferase 2B15 [Acanthoscelides obtectus]
MLNDNNFQVLLQSNKHFDLIILEYSINDALIGLGQKFNAPVVLLSPRPSSAAENHIFANPAPAAFIPNVFSGYTGFMNFWQRVRNLFLNSYVNLYRRTFDQPFQRAVLNQWISGIELDDAMKNVSLILLNSLPGITEPVPHMPNMIEIGGLHVEEDADVPRDIVKFLDEANEGVILHTGYANRDEAEIYVKTFARLTMKVLWKTDFTYNDLEDITCSGCSVPDNVKLVSSLPQENVLAHKNVKAFITNGNLFDLIDAAYFGVPVVGIPKDLVEETNMALAVENKYAVELSNNDLTEENIIRAIDEVVLNPRYKANAELKSAIIKDQETKPLDRATYWVEYVIRHKGAYHLQSPGIFLKWYQRSMIDIILILGVLDIILFLIFYYIFKHIIHHVMKLYKRKKSEKYVKLIE